MHNMFNLCSCYEFLKGGGPAIVMADWLTKWCDENLKSYRLQKVYVEDGREERSRSYRIALVIEDEDDVLLFFTRFHNFNGEVKAHYFGPFTIDEISQPFDTTED